MWGSLKYFSEKKFRHFMSQVGFEPTTPEFSALCSTNWATETGINNISKVFKY